MGDIVVITTAAPFSPAVTRTDWWMDLWAYDPSKEGMDSLPRELMRDDWDIIDGQYVMVDYAAPAL
jgi:hypothetical protein